MNEIKIRKNIPMPAHRMKYPFADMQVGDSFEIPANKIKSAAVCGGNYARTRGGMIKFSVRRVDGKHFIWRIK